MKKFVYIKAEIVAEQEHHFTVKLLNGFGTPTEIVDRDDAILRERLSLVQKHIEAGGANEHLTAATVLMSEILR